MSPPPDKGLQHKRVHVQRREDHHFSHYRIASGRVSVIEMAGTRPDHFERFASATPGWHRSAWEKREVIHSGPFATLSAWSVRRCETTVNPW
jgi:hypothetical protein